MSSRIFAKLLEVAQTMALVGKGIFVTQQRRQQHLSYVIDMDIMPSIVNAKLVHTHHHVHHHKSPKDREISLRALGLDE